MRTGGSITGYLKVKKQPNEIQKAGPMKHSLGGSFGTGPGSGLSIQGLFGRLNLILLRPPIKARRNLSHTTICRCDTPFPPHESREHCKNMLVGV